MPAAAAGGTLEQRQLIAAMDNGREVVLEQTGFFARDEARQHENGLARASFPNGDAFVGAGHAKPVRAGSLKGFGDLWPAVAVAVALDDGQDLARRLALLSRRIHVVANGCEVVRERTERNLGPDRPSCFTAGTFLFAWHVPSMEQRVHPAAGKCQFTTTASRGKTARWAAARKRQHLVAAGWSGPGSSRWGALRGP